MEQMATPERFELPTNWFEASYSIQLSYGAVFEFESCSPKIIENCPHYKGVGDKERDAYALPGKLKSCCPTLSVSDT